MKIAFDEHVPPRALDAIRSLLEDKKHGDIEIVSARDYADPPATSDVPWLRKFKEDSGEVVITGDKKIRGRLAERQALIELGLIVFFVPPKWKNWRFMKQSAFLLLWWDVIVQVAKTANPGDCWELPGILTPSVEKLRNVTGPKENP